MFFSKFVDQLFNFFAMNKQEIFERINKLKRKHNAIILAHNYQVGDVQDVADFVGDSFGLSQKAAQTDADVIVFCGVKFMAESAKILSPDKTVLLPNANAGCPLADMLSVQQLRQLKQQYPGVPVVTYVNSTAAVKAESDICCTSSNALKVVNSLDSDTVIFAPDKNLGHYVQEHTDKKLIIWDGFCPTHNSLAPEDVDEIKAKYPQAEILIHPEAPAEVLEKADFVGSTGQILNYVRNSEHREFIIGTEEGILHTLRVQNPDKQFYLLSKKLLCRNMKKITLESVLHSLETMTTEIVLPQEIMAKAKRALDRMLEVV